jgi:FKBP12-rapamycin complex-associated protein
MNPVFDCLRNLAAAVDHALMRYMHELLDLMFSAGLSDAFVQALVDLGKFIPPLLPLIQGKMNKHLDILAKHWQLKNVC